MKCKCDNLMTDLCKRDMCDLLLEDFNLRDDDVRITNPNKPKGVPHSLLCIYRDMEVIWTPYDFEDILREVLLNEDKM